MPTNLASAFNTGGVYGTGDIEGYIADETLPLARRQLVAFQFGDPLSLPEGRGTTYQASRYNRIVLPYTTLTEGAPPVGESMTLTQVSATVQQWGDLVKITDVAELTIKHPLFQKAIELVALQVAETLERNTFNNLMAGTNVNYVNTRGARASLVAGDVMNPHEINRVYGTLVTNGAPRFMGDEMTNTKVAAAGSGDKAASSASSQPHYVALMHPLVMQDFRENATVINAWSYSDLNRLYNFEDGKWGGIRFCFSNMVPSFTAGVQQNGTAGTAGSLATNATYYIIVTASDTQNQYESVIYAVSSAINVTGPNGSISLTTPATTGFTYNIYLGTTTSPTRLATTVSGPSSGPLAGQAVQLPPSTAVVLTNIGLLQTPPAIPGAGLTVYPTFIFGRGAYGQVMLKDVEFSYLKEKDKSDPLNQLRIVGWKCFYGMLIINNVFFARIESVSAFSATYG